MPSFLNESNPILTLTVEYKTMFLKLFPVNVFTKLKILTRPDLLI